MVVPLSPDDAHLPSPLSPQSSSRHLLAATQIVRPMRAPDTYRGGYCRLRCSCREDLRQGGHSQSYMEVSPKAGIDGSGDRG